MDLHTLSPLFEAVQRARVFPDSKTFVDCVPRHELSKILAAYRAEATRAGFNLHRFVADHFDPPPSTPDEPQGGGNVTEYIHALWSALRREPDRVVPGSSLLPLPHPYIVPGGRFREIYYWDSYFTMLGLRDAGDEAMIGHMTDNFAWLIRHYGHVPNGNRVYYLSRSQPPYFALMVDLLAAHQPAALVNHADVMAAE